MRILHDQDIPLRLLKGLRLWQASMVPYEDSYALAIMGLIYDVMPIIKTPI